MAGILKARQASKKPSGETHESFREDSTLVWNFYPGIAQSAESSEIAIFVSSKKIIFK